MSAAAVETELRKCCPLTVTAYKRDEVSAAQIKAWAEDLTESLSEKWGDEYGDPDGNWSLPDEADEIMLAAVTKIVRGMTVWRCADCGTVELTGDQVVEWARRESPDWFGEPTP